MRALLRALTPGKRLVMVGDADQLTSVGPGNVLGDIIASEIIPTTHLTEIYRQSDKSMIVHNAHRINRGEMPILNARGGDFFFERQANAEDAATVVTELCSRRLPDFLHCNDPTRFIQVMSPTKKGSCGVHALNQLLQSHLNPAHDEKMELRRGDVLFRSGDKVMQIANDYQREWTRGDEEGDGVFNGDMGVVDSIDLEARSVFVRFDDDRLTEYGASDLESLELAYCVTVHKSQGSEFPVVVIPVVGGPPMLLTRNLFYTAVTRARQMVVLVGREDAIYAMVNNHRILHRYSALADRLRGIVS